MSKKVTKINKIPITALLQVLSQLFEEGVDYIDIENSSTDENKGDILKVTVRPEYYSEAPEIEIEIEQQIRKTGSSLSDEDINDLI